MYDFMQTPFALRKQSKFLLFIFFICGRPCRKAGQQLINH